VGEMIDCNLVTKQKVGGGLNLPIKLRKGQIVTTKLSDNSFASLGDKMHSWVVAVHQMSVLKIAQ
jgi:hypothetical protein